MNLANTDPLNLYSIIQNRCLKSIGFDLMIARLCPMALEKKMAPASGETWPGSKLWSWKDLMILKNFVDETLNSAVIWFSDPMKLIPIKRVTIRAWWWK